MKTTMIIVGIIWMISLVSATTIIAGNQEIVILEVNPSSCVILDSQNDSLSNYSLDGLNFTIDGNKVIINTNPALKPDNYTLICDYSWTEEVPSSSGGGGGGCRYNKNFDWKCTDWSECSNGEQTRECKERNNCGDTYGRPNVTKSCSVGGGATKLYDPDEPTEPVEEEQKRNIWLGIFLALLIIIAIIISWKAFKSKKPIKSKKPKNENSDDNR